MTEIQIFYFSGTGNSLHLARELKQRLQHATLVPIVSALQENEYRSTAPVVGIVFPIYAFTLPPLVARFLEQADFSSAQFLFALASRECSSRVFRRIDRLLKGRSRPLDACWSQTMPQNYVPTFTMADQAANKKMEEELQAALDRIAPLIQAREKQRRPWDGPLLVPFTWILFPFFTWLYNKTNYFGLEERFYTDDSCTGCGLCARTCLSGKIKMDGKQPVWQPDVACLHCLACLHYCPEQAIQLRDRKTKERGRYHHPAVTAQDIAGQKSWGE